MTASMTRAAATMIEEVSAGQLLAGAEEGAEWPSADDAAAQCAAAAAGYERCCNGYIAVSIEYILWSWPKSLIDCTHEKPSLWAGGSWR
jgi:hypothetical protein